MTYLPLLGIGLIAGVLAGMFGIGGGLVIVPALLYLKMRQFGGETISDVMAQHEELEGARSQWQRRMRSRLTVTPQSRTPTY